MIVTVDRLARVYDPAAVAALAPGKDVVGDGWDDQGRFWVQFAVNLSTAEQAAVRRWLSTGGDVENTLHERAADAYQTLQQYEGLASPTNAQTLAVVRLLCKVVRALIRLQLRHLDAAD